MNRKLSSHRLLVFWIVTGFIAGPFSVNGTGSGSDLQCLPESPDKPQPEENSGGNPAVTSNAFLSPVKLDSSFTGFTDSTVECAVCHLRSRETQVRHYLVIVS